MDNKYFGISSLVCAIIGIFGFRVFGIYAFVFLVLAVVLGVIGLLKKQKYSKIGLVLGAVMIGLILFVIFILGSIFVKLHNIAVN